VSKESGINNSTEEVKVQLQALKEQSQQALQLYKDGIANLKTYPLHSKLQSEGKTTLIDVYYKEDQMNSFRDSLKKQLEKLKFKVEAHLVKCNQLQDQSKGDETSRTDKSTDSSKSAA
jgi:hypothetical protein